MALSINKKTKIYSDLFYCKLIKPHKLLIYIGIVLLVKF